MIIAIFFEFPEIILKLVKGACEKWPFFEPWLKTKSPLHKTYEILRKHEFWIDGVALIAWLFILLGLVIEVGANQRARVIQDDEFKRVNTLAQDAGLLAARISATNAWIVSSNLQLSIQLAELRQEKIAIHRAMLGEGSNFITSRLKMLKPLSVRIARAGNSSEVLHLGLELVNIFKTVEPDVVLVDSQTPISGVTIYWKDWGGHGQDIDADSKEVVAKAQISEQILTASGQVLDFNRTLFVEQTNMDFGLIIVIGENAR